MRFLLLGVSDRLGLTDQRFFEVLSEAAREAQDMEHQRLQPYLFRLTRVPVPSPKTLAADPCGYRSEPPCGGFARAGDDIDDDDFQPLCFACGQPVDSKIGWVRYDDGRAYHKACDDL